MFHLPIKTFMRFFHLIRFNRCIGQVFIFRFFIHKALFRPSELLHMLKTPDYRIESECVYPPSEDTFILLDALELDRELLRNLKPQILLEVGSGSGVVTIFLRQLLELESNAPIISFCTDINNEALHCTRKTAVLNNMKSSELVQCDLFSALLPRINSFVDVLVFNPPYVPSEVAATSVKDFYYAGGPIGRYAIDRVLPEVNQLLSPNGVFYLVALKENNIEDIMKQSLLLGFSSAIVLQRRCGIEYLYVLKFCRIK